MMRPRRVLVFRLGSLGDTLITMPVFHLLNRLWPDAEKRVLTNFPVQSKAPPLSAVLGEETFAQGYFAYPVGTRSPATLWALAREIRQWKPDIAINANQSRSFAATVRDYAFLKACCAGPVYGLPFGRSARQNRIDPETGLHEREAARIARALAPLGDAETENPANRALALTPAEHRAAEEALAGWKGAHRFIAFSVGTKWPENDWSDEHWAGVFALLSARHPEMGLLALGAAEDRDRSARLLSGLGIPTLNCCGQVSPRTSAAILERAACFVGNDSGPMHLAAAAGTPAVAIFSRKNPPGIWFPLGDEHRIFYPDLAWSGGTPPVFRQTADETGIMSIPVDQVADACSALAGTADQGRSNE